MNGKKLRCRRCRRAVGDATCLAADCGPVSCCIWHMDVDNLPEWIWISVQQAVWTSGKLNCFHCGARLGGYSFLNRYRCPCGRDATVHFSRSRVDLDQKPRLLIVPRRRTGRGSAQAQQEGPALDPVCAGGTPQHGAAVDTDAPQLDSSVRRAAEPQAESDHEDRSDAVPWESGAPAGLASLASLASSSAAPQETEEAERQQEAVSSSQGPVVLSSLARTRLSKTDQNRLKSRRRKQRRRERWLQSQLQEEEEKEPAQSSPARPPACEDVDRDGLTCAVCLDVFFRPRSCLPCAHVFCEPCLRRLARNRAAHTPCPLCRRLISNTGFHRELDHRAKTLFPKVWATRRQNFQNSLSARWPLPSSREQTRYLCCHGRSAEAVWRRWHLNPRPFDLGMQGLPQLPFATLIVLFVISFALLLYLAGFFFTLFT
ncbi:E3 ubiquitin-protein ligase RNF180-like isoform X1 [Xiphophorus hellerii]|uniref:E3 ubiquitin-protein ligase RNF180-like isoform X1 n=2 Tax=Xiphophorus hellerii TaxID=8084 RepID=UPI0013B37DBD|nr:E3 ubiquitin-protein ligase RNF180-like isoform X1 [Xiphophorus hellerii]XP_032426217.1 E3 ubiquitin-protein ligase RNF180-like isoform X1 [Xiphophorus hellerii]